MLLEGRRAILPAVPVTVLTLGFHVITPFGCNIVGHSVLDARKAMLMGGSVPLGSCRCCAAGRPFSSLTHDLSMVLSWDAVVLGLSGTTNAALEDPRKLLLSVNSSAFPAVQGFAFAVGYAVSFAKRLADILDLIAQQLGRKQRKKCHGNSTSSSVLITWLVLIVPTFYCIFLPCSIC
ncbi:unnamed protein product [Musa textilis]